MKANSRFQITSKQLIFILIGTSIATGILSLPRVVSAEADQDAWIAIILATSVPMLSWLMIERLGRRFPNLTIVEMASLLLGKFFGTIFSIGFIIYLILFESVVLRLGSEITSQFVLPQTPISVISMLIIISVIYIAQKGAKVIGRLNELLFYFLLFDLLVLLFSLNLADSTNFFPVGGAGGGKIIKALLPTAYAYAGVEILFVTYPMVTKKEEVLKAGFIALGIIMIFYVTVTVISILVMGVEVIQYHIWPVLELAKVVDVPVIERLEFFFLVVWLGVVARPVINHCFSAAFSLTQLLKLDVNKHYSLMVIAVGCLIYVISLIPSNLVLVLKYATYVGYSFLIVAIAYPLLLHLVVILQKGRLKKS
ncbi:MAG: endospore germination permease [Clostridia bacterium]|nr:endospore germination permease [Clostridia bacterium]